MAKRCGSIVRQGWHHSAIPTLISWGQQWGRQGGRCPDLLSAAIVVSVVGPQQDARRGYKHERLSSGSEVRTRTEGDNGRLGVPNGHAGCIRRSLTLSYGRGFGRGESK